MWVPFCTRMLIVNIIASLIPRTLPAFHHLQYGKGEYCTGDRARRGLRTRLIIVWLKHDRGKYICAKLYIKTCWRGTLFTGDRSISSYWCSSGGTFFCGLLAKWLWFGLGLGLGQGPGNALAVFFFSLRSYKCSEQLGSVVSVSSRWFTHGSCHVVSHFRSSDRSEPRNGVAERYFFLGNQIIAVDRSWCHGH